MRRRWRTRSIAISFVASERGEEEDEEGADDLDQDDGEGGGEGDNDEGDGEGMLSVREIVRDNGRPDDSTSKRWLVRYEGEPDDVEVWVPKHQLPLDLFLEFEETRHTRVNRALEPLLSAARSGPSERRCVVRCG